MGSWGHNSVAAAKRQEVPLLTHLAACPSPGRMKKYNGAVGASAKFACILTSLNPGHLKSAHSSIYSDNSKVNGIELELAMAVQI